MADQMSFAASALNILEQLVQQAGELTLPKLLETTMDTMIRLSGAQRGFLLLQEGDRLNFQVGRNYTRGEVAAMETQVSFTIIRQVAQSGQPLLIPDAQLDETVHDAASIRVTGVRAVVCCPLVSLRGQVKGIVYLDDLRAPATFDESDMRMLIVFSTQAATAIENAQLQERVGQQDLQFAALDRLRQEFIQALSHELRTPLTAVTTALQILEQVGEAEGRAAILSTARQGLDRFVTLVTRLLDFTSEEMDFVMHGPEQTQIILLRPFAAQWIDAYETTIRSKKLTLTNQVPAGLGCQASLSRLNRAIAAVLDNALQYTPPGGEIQLRGRAVDPHQEQPLPAIVLQGSSFICLEVTDTGPGIPATELPHVCERFFRGAQHAATGGGLGLGLFIARRDILGQGGDILVLSEEGFGTRVRIYLPGAEMPH